MAARIVRTFWEVDILYVRIYVKKKNIRIERLTKGLGWKMNGFEERLTINWVMKCKSSKMENPTLDSLKESEKETYLGRPLLVTVLKSQDISE